jgi:hypothetical protein
MLLASEARTHRRQPHMSLGSACGLNLAGPKPLFVLQKATFLFPHRFRQGLPTYVAVLQVRRYASHLRLRANEARW